MRHRNSLPRGLPVYDRPQLAEYHKDQNIEELADLLEVINAVTIARGYSLQELEQVCEEKATKRGGFAKRMLLKDIYED